MTKEAGLWIDHEHAVIVTLLEEGEDIKHITSNVSPESHDDSAEDKRDRRFGDHLNKYYDEVIASLHDTDSILILGPGEAKGQLEKRLQEHAVSGRKVTVETADKLTDGQIAAQVRHHFGR